MSSVTFTWRTYQYPSNIATHPSSEPVRPLTIDRRLLRRDGRSIHAPRDELLDGTAADPRRRGGRPGPPADPRLRGDRRGNLACGDRVALIRVATLCGEVGQARELIDRHRQGETG